MPPRVVCLAVLLGWLAMMGWLFARDIWPALRPGQPPPYTIDLADEAQLQAPDIRWAVLRRTGNGEQRIGKALTRVTPHQPDNTFEMHIEIYQLELKSMLGTIKVPKMASMYRVTPDGDLRDITASAQIQLPLAAPCKGEVRGNVRAGRFWPHGRVEWGQDDPLKLDMEPVEVPAHGSVFNPLHPVNRIGGLRPGQRWRMPQFDPLAEAVAASLAKFLKLGKPLPLGPRFLDAEVQPPKTLVWNKREVACLVIVYRSDEISASTWVRQQDGLVLRQEAGKPSDSVILQRE